MITTAEKKPRTKRVRTYFKSREIAHQWAHQLVPYGRSPSNMSFRGPAFMSYGTVIARILTYRGRKAYVINSASMSISTSRHQGEARSAIPHDAKIFRAEVGRGEYSLFPTPQKLRDFYIQQRSEVKPEGKLQRQKDRAILRRADFLNDAIEVCEFFKLPAKSLYNQRVKCQAEVDAARERLEAWEKGREERAEKAAATRQRNRISNAEAFIACPEQLSPPSWGDLCCLPAELRARVDAAMPAYQKHRVEQRRAFQIAAVEKFIADPVNEDQPWDLGGLPDDIRARFDAAIALRDQAMIDAWLRGENVHLGYDGPTLLRAKMPPALAGAPWEMQMETSKGVTVPLADAERAFKFVDHIRKHRGCSWHRNGEKFAIGDFQLDAVNEHGVVAGCHRITWAEIDRFAGVMGWNEVEVVTE